MATDQRLRLGSVQCRVDLRCPGAAAAVSGDRRHIARSNTNRERLRQAAAVFDCTREGVLVSDRQGLIVHVNRAFMEITGYQREEVLGRQPSMFKSGHHLPAFYEAMFQSLNSSGEWSGEIWNRRKNGEIYPQWQ